MSKEEFLKDIGAWSNHRHLLWRALEATEGPVLELGAGEGSTPYFKQYCHDENRTFRSYDSNQDWAKKMGVYYNDGNWDALNCWEIHWSVVLLDLAPGEYRRIALMKLSADIICVHDSERIGWNSSDYRIRPLFSKFKHTLDDIPKEHGAPWTTLLSNKINVKSWVI